jgi:endonuclease-3
MTPKNIDLKEKLEKAIEKLESEFGPQIRYSSKNGLEQLIATILSQRTNYANERKAYEAMFEQFKDWEGIAKADTDQLIKAISTTTYPEQKAPRIQQILTQLHEETGQYSLEFIRFQPVDEAMKWLMKFPGVGFKTATFMLLFTFKKPVLPVDTHVYRVCLRLGIYDKKMTQAKAHTFLLDHLRKEADYLLNFHKLLFKHGQKVCTYSDPACKSCTLLEMCPTGRGKLNKNILEFYESKALEKVV